MEDLQDGPRLCERCNQLDSRLLLSSTPSSPWRPWLVADVIDSAATTGCAFCCMLVNDLDLVDAEEEGRNGKVVDKALSKLRNIKIGSRTIARKAEKIQRERTGWITFSAWGGTGEKSNGITRVRIAVTDSKQSGDWWRSYILGPGPRMPQQPSSVSEPVSGSPAPVGRIFQSTSQPLADLSASIHEWRQRCHDHHECWKPLSQRRNRAENYVKLPNGTILRDDLAKDLPLPVWSKTKQAPLELEQGRLESVALPSRCLEIVPGGDDDDQCSFWLRETEGEAGRYVILSHRWVPDTERVRTLKSNYRQRVDGGSGEAPPIAPGDVTKIFQEAAQLTARLGLKYIWIDSLCIVQDDADDWKREATKMAHYYQNAWLTIAANSTEGLFRPADKELLPPVLHLPYTDDAGRHQSGLSIQPTFNSHLNELYDKTITASQLLSRGWVFQEWLLSPRIVAFSQNAGPFVVCSEDRPWSAILKSQVSEQRQLATDMSYKSGLKLSLGVVADIADSWRRVVEAYSGLDLTKVAGDRFIALAGVASEFGTAFGRALDSTESDGPGSYLCGLWWEGLSRDMQWEPVDRRDLTRVPGIPSWSWASLGRIKAGEEDTTDASKIEPAAVRWHTRWPWYVETCFKLEEGRRVSSATDQTVGQPRIEEASPIDGGATQSDFGIENRFLALRVKGQLLWDLWLGETWSGVEMFTGARNDPYRAAKLTANQLISVGTAEASKTKQRPDNEFYADEAWHQVKRSARSDEAIGWALFDDTNLRVENGDSGPYIAGDRPRPIYAFRLSVARQIPVKIGLATKVDIYAVLFVAEVDTRIDGERCFERVGMGRITQENDVFESVWNDDRAKSHFWLV